MKDKPEFTWKNWWYYNKWFVLLGVAAVVIVLDIVIGNIRRVKPDYQMAYVGAHPLTEESATAIEGAMSAMGEDLNGDGRIVFQLNQYPTAQGADPEVTMGKAGWETLLMADLLDRESYFFLLEDAGKFQDDYDILEPDIFSAAGIDALRDIGGLDNLTLARRSFEPGRTGKYTDGCIELWNKLTGETFE